MRTLTPRLLAALLALCLVTGCGGADGGDDGGTGPRPVRVSVVVRDGKVVGGVERHAVEQGARVTVRVTSDEAEELHLHGYDLSRDLRPGRPAELSFTADIAGVFEAELEGSGKKLFELAVS